MPCCGADVIFQRPGRFFQNQEDPEARMGPVEVNIVSVNIPPCFRGISGKFRDGNAKTRCAVSVRHILEAALLHMSVFSQSFSPCGRFLAAGNNYGEIALFSSHLSPRCVFSLAAALSPDATTANQKPVLTFTAHEGPVFSLLSTDSVLLSAGNGEVSAWNWTELIKKNAKPLWTKRPNYKSSLEIPEINSMAINPRDDSLAIGAGDNNVHILDLEHGAFKATLQGHTDYVHCVCVREREAELLSGSEDGAVRMWGEWRRRRHVAVLMMMMMMMMVCRSDCRTGQSVHCIELHKYESCARPQHGKWISCLTTDSDWMVRGHVMKLQTQT
ncbi:hypothetical protein CCH79_00019811 [Gambusia affinis]|uniref:Uncharacterized protein n=1 Tax=Gambusia affinis TaxID=33528 RepID=A0A315W058_GAMAF|nr:hypothetical protein CCH79_00019811 [Gambusia affinis]